MVEQLKCRCTRDWLTVRTKPPCVPFTDAASGNVASPTAAAGQLQPRRLRLAPADTAEGGADGMPGSDKPAATLPPHQTPGMSPCTVQTIGSSSHNALECAVDISRSFMVEWWLLVFGTFDVAQGQTVDHSQDRCACLHGLAACLVAYTALLQLPPGRANYSCCPVRASVSCDLRESSAWHQGQGRLRMFAALPQLAAPTGAPGGI
jgi:hypothetical protein